MGTVVSTGTPPLSRVVLLLTVQKSCNRQLSLVVHPIIYQGFVLNIQPDGDGEPALGFLKIHQRRIVLEAGPLAVQHDPIVLIVQGRSSWIGKSHLETKGHGGVHKPWDR